MKRTLLALLLALTLLLTCAVPVFAEGTLPNGTTDEDYVELSLNDGVVELNQFFKVKLDETRTISKAIVIPYLSDGSPTYGELNLSTSSNVNVGFIDKNTVYFTSTPTSFEYMYVSLVGMSLREVSYDCQSIDNNTVIVHRSENPSGEYTYDIKYVTYGVEPELVGSTLSYNGEDGPITYDLADSEFEWTDVYMTFSRAAGTESLPTDKPLEAEKLYFHTLVATNEVDYEYMRPIYIAVSDGNDGYTLYNAFEENDVVSLGINLLGNGVIDYGKGFAALTLNADSPLVGLTYKGQYSADLIESNSRVVYYDNSKNKYMTFENAEGGKTIDSDYAGTALPGMILFFGTESSDEGGEDEPPVTPDTPAPSYPQYYPDYDEPTTVQPAPEAPAAEADEYVVVCRRLNVRRTPSTRYARIGRLCRGDVVNVVEWVGKWAKIEWNGGTAYVHGNYISPVD